MPLHDGDFAPDPDNDGDGHEMVVESGDRAPLPPAPEAPSYDAALKKPRRRRRAADAPTAPLVPGAVLGLDTARWDWRARALSRSPHASGRWWFPDAWRVRSPPPMSKLTEVQPLWPEVQRYNDHFTPLLRAERDEAERQFYQRLKDWTHERLRREGYMLDGLGADAKRQPKTKVDGRVVTFYLGERRQLGSHQFEPGQTVLLSRTSPLVDAVPDPKAPNDPLKGTVYSNGKNTVRVVFPALPDDLETGVWRIDVGLNLFSFKRQEEALARLNLDPVQQDAADAASAARAPVVQTMSAEDEALEAVQRSRTPEQRILTGTGLRDLLLRRFQTDYTPPTPGPRGVVDDADDVGFATLEMKPSDMEAEISPSPHDSAAPRGILGQNKLIDSWTRRYRTPEGRAPLVVEGDPHIPLNASQTRAIAMMLSERLSLVQGPPGTGKTRVIVETIKLLKQHWQVPHPILVCAHTNVAVDNLLDGLRAQGLKPLRFGTAARVPESLQDLTFEAQLEKHPLWRYHERLRREREEVLSEIADGGMAKTDSRQKHANTLNRRIFMLRRRIQFEVLADADVVCTTCLSATSKLLDAIDFPLVFLDEASMATEPLSLVPLTKGSAQVAIIGDHKQLPPVIVSDEAQAGGLATSMFERLIHEKHIPSIMLDTQYRMHPAISAFSSRAFYNGELRDGTVGSDGSVRAGLEPPDTAFLLRDAGGAPLNVTFLNHDYPESPENRSIANYHEAGRVCDIVADLLHHNPGLRGADIGVIAPYAAQIRVISEYLCGDADRAAAFHAWLGPERAAEVGDIEVRTVDGFEGREKDVVIFSTTRSNAAGYIGFLADWRRLNVGLTRAKRGLIMLGSARTLTYARVGEYASAALPRDGARVWHELMTHLADRGMVMDDPA